MAVSTTHMRHTAPVFQWPRCHAQQQFEKIRMCSGFNYVHTHTHIHILHLQSFHSNLHRGPIERKKDQTNMIFCLLARKMVVRPPSTGDISFIFMAQKDKCVTVKWQKQLYTASTCFAKLAEIPQWWWSWVHADPVGFVLVCGTVLLTGNHETMHSRSFYGVMKVL